MEGRSPGRAYLHWLGLAEELAVFARRRAKAARDSYEVERVKGLTPEEKMMEDWLKSQQ